MNNTINPNHNHFNNDMEKEEKDETTIENDDDDEINETDNTNDKKTISKEQYRAKLLKLFGIIIIIFIVIIFVAYLFSKVTHKKYNYDDVEQILENASIQYFKDNKDDLPKNISSNVEIHEDILVEKEYMKEIKSYIGKECTGKVIVKKVSSNNYSYTPYLNCGTDYVTSKLYDKIVKKSNIVTTGYGLYEMNGEYVYRGKEVNNFVKFKDSNTIWRIIKVDKNKDIVLIHADKTENMYEWDNRYNNALEYNSGINVFDKSEVSTILKDLYKGYYGSKDDPDYQTKYYKYSGETVLLTKKDKTRLNSFDACVGHRGEEDSSRDGSSECSVTYNSNFGLLSVYDYLNASIDPNCKTTVSPECQNYNYLNDVKNYWLSNGDGNTTNKVYFVSSALEVKPREASDNTYLRVVIHLNNDAMIHSGNGSHKKPFIIK